MMRWLLWKDYRANRMILGLAIFLLVVPHLFVLVGVLATPRNSPADEYIPNLATGLIVSTVWSLGLLQVAAAFLGGNALAGERMERTAEFLAYLPVTRRQILTSKLVVVLGVLAVIWLPNLLILGLASRGVTFGHTAAADAFVPLRLMPFIGSAMFGIAWLASATSRNPSLAVCLGLLAPAAVGLTLWGLAALCVWLGYAETLASAVKSLGPDLEHIAPLLAEASYDGLCLAVAIVCFAVGTRKYLRRVEP